jgi:hypothetical protein
MKKCIYALLIVLGSMATTESDGWNIHVSHINFSVNIGQY